jgi:plastocyanin
MLTKGLALAAGTGALLVLGGCSLKEYDNANMVNGKKLFVAKCGSCHTLARANTKGIVGPNLDEAFREALHDGLGRDTIRGVVHSQILFPETGGSMPKGLLSGQDAIDVAAYVAYASDRPGNDPGLLALAVPSATAGPPAVEKNGTLALAANPSGQLAYTTNQAKASAGKVTITMTNMSGTAHNVAIQTGTSGPVIGATPVQSSGTSSISVSLKPGTYTFFCQVPGHRQAGMYGTLTVK